VAELDADGVAPITFELVALAQARAGASGQPVVAALVGGPGTAARAPLLFARGIGEVYILEHESLSEAGADERVRALVTVCVRAKPDLVLVGQTPAGRDIAPALAQRLGGGVVMNVVEIRDAGPAGGIEVVCPVFGGGVRAVYRFGETRPQVLGVQQHMIDAAPPSVASSRTVTNVDASSLDGSVRRTSVRGRSASTGPRLQDARVLVSGGLGLGEKDNFKYVEELAGVLDGLPAASRQLVDHGWVPPSLQVGLTGKIVAPELYLAIGISGASQHVAGMSSAKTIVAVNTDRKAPIFDYAKYGVIADCVEFLPAFIDACRKLPAR
jgi:electron transfer flavoprotein alpha subunit